MSVLEKDPPKVSVETSSCFHCGDECLAEKLEFENHTFCCSGCKTVYQILSENDLCEYYSLSERPGIKADSLNKDGRFAYLDNETVSSSILEFNEGEIAKVTFLIPQMHCSSCIWLLENLSQLNEGVVRSTVNFIKKEASIVFNTSQLSLRQLVELMTAIGYEPQINKKDNSKKRLSTERSLIIKIGVAGFCFGNIMLMSFPEYFGDHSFDSSEFRVFFGFANIALSLPVMFYSAKDYFTSAYKILKHKNVNIDVPIALGVAVLFIRSVIDIVSGMGAGYMDSLAGLIFFLLVGKWYQDKTYKTLSYERDYRSYFPIAITKISIKGEQEAVPIEEIKTDDVLLIRNQEVIPADCELVSGEAQIDYSFVTGESEPVSKKSGDLIYAGGRQCGAAIQVKVKKTVGHSYLTQLWNQDIFHKEDSAKMASMIDRISKRFTLIIIAFSLIGLTYWSFFSAHMAFNVFTSVLIIACPCALALAIPFTFGNTIKWLGRSGMYLKNHRVVEDLGSIKSIVFDKTGTITQNKQLKVDFVGTALSKLEIAAVKSLVAQSLHPLSQSIYKHLEGETIKVESYSELPGKGIEGITGGYHVRVGSERFVCGNIGQSFADSIRTYIAINNEVKGFFTLSKGYRPGLAETITALKLKNDIYLLSGDNDAERSFLSQWFDKKDHTERMFFAQSPQDKLEKVSMIQSGGNKVMMIGDGLNDAGALKQSDVGVAVADNVYAFSPACDAILDARSFHNLPLYLEFAEKSMAIVRWCFLISFSYNSVGMYFALTGALSPLVAAILMPLSSVTVIAFTTIATNRLANKLGMKDLNER
jgi:Cu+-exporting ATPase